MNQFNKFLLLAFFSLTAVAISCEKDNSNKDEKPEDKNITISKWVYSNMEMYYFWNAQLPTTVNFTEKTDPEAFFYDDLIYDEEDKWSFITDDYEAFNAELSGTPTSMGYSPAFYRFSSSDQVFIVVEFVYPGSPAENAGLMRGDIILMINSTVLDVNNYYDLYSETQQTLRLGEASGNQISMGDKTLTMTAMTIDADPLIFDTVFTINSSKIGYLVYSGFILGTDNKYLASLGNAIDNFKTEGVNDLIIDLRYNGGGRPEAALYIASAVAPENIVNAKSDFIKYVYNKEVQAAIIQTEGPERLTDKLTPNGHHLDLDRVYFLTTNRTASASELLIIGLEPYITVKIVGTATYGKYTGAWVIPDEHNPPQHNWAIMPIVMKYSNSQGITDFVNGLTPDIEVEDDLLTAKAFGDMSDQVLSTAIQDITGIARKTTEKKSLFPVYEQFDDRISRSKRVLVLPSPAVPSR